MQPLLIIIKYWNNRSYINSEKIIKNLFRIIYKEKKFKLSLAGALVLLLISILSNISTPRLLKYFVDEAFTHPNSPIEIIIICYVIVWTTSQLSISLREILLHGLEQKSIQLLSIETLEHIFKLYHSYHTHQSTGEIISNLYKIKQSVPVILWGLIF